MPAGSAQRSPCCSMARRRLENTPYCLRTFYRHVNPPDIGLDMVGFRGAADIAVR